MCWYIQRLNLVLLRNENKLYCWIFRREIFLTTNYLLTYYRTEILIIENKVRTRLK